MKIRLRTASMSQAAAVNVVRFLQAEGVDHRNMVSRHTPAGVEYSEARHAALIALLEGKSATQRCGLNVQMARSEIELKAADKTAAARESSDMRLFWWRCSEAALAWKNDRLHQLAGAAYYSRIQTVY